MTKERAMKEIAELPDYAEVTISRDFDAEVRNVGCRLIRQIDEAYRVVPGEPRTGATYRRTVLNKIKLACQEFIAGQEHETHQGQN